MAENKKKTSGGGDWGWPLIILSFCFGLWPIGLVLLFGKLFADDVKKPARQAPPLWEAAGQPQRKAAPPRQQTKAAKAVKKITKSPQTKKSTARCLEIVGGALLIGGAVSAGFALDDAIRLSSLEFIWPPELLRALAAMMAGEALLAKGVFMEGALKRYSRYLLVMGDREAVPIDELARTLGYSERRVEKDLEKMIDKGYFGGRAYLNVELGYLFRSDGAGEAFRQRFQEAQTAEAKAPPKEAEEGYSGILRNIRRANDQIADPILSAKIDRLEEITAKIFKAVEEDPRKKDRIGTFLNYYLPTTQKLLNSYATFEAAGVEGENLRQAKERIETTMDSIVKGFEHQLDELYKADAMDVDSDIRVMEHMLRRDTGSAEQDFGLGGSAVQTAPEDE